MAGTGGKEAASTKAQNTINVLLVESDEADSQTIQRLLAQSTAVPIQVARVEWLSSALKQLTEESYDAILMDFAILEAHGHGMYQQIQSAVARVPIVLLAKQKAESSALQALEYGAQDYLLKDALATETLEMAIRKAILRKKAEKNLSYLAQPDHLTEVANRALFRDRIIQALARRKRKPQNMAIVRLGLDHFTTINDEFGQDAGDAVLKNAASRLQACLREVDTVARLWGDEFTIHLDGMANISDAKLVSQRILDAIAKPFPVGSQQVSLTASIGIAPVTGDKDGVDELLQQAEEAMNEAKGKGGNQYCFYNAGDG